MFAAFSAASSFDCPEYGEGACRQTALCSGLCRGFLLRRESRQHIHGCEPSCLLAPVMRYLEMEYGPDWIGTRALQVGAVLHHGDIPQETREVLEALLRHGDVRLAICTSTLAEGVNLPIRTLVLYSVQRRSKSGQPENLLARDIKNLVGRAGRAGATTKGLVICANADQWHVVEPVARQVPGEHVKGALRTLIARLQRALIHSCSGRPKNGDRVSGG